MANIKDVLRDIEAVELTTSSLVEFDLTAGIVIDGSLNSFVPSNLINLSTLSESGINGGFVINGIDSFDFSGGSISNAGDINGDDFEDFIIGALRGDPNNTNDAGESYLVFGDASLDLIQEFELSSIDGSNGLIINGINLGDLSGRSVSNAGDINGDDFEDFIIGADFASPNGVDRAGVSYVVFGGFSAFDPSFDLSNLDGNNGFVINGIESDDGSGFSVSSAGDINGDGIDDLIIGAYLGDGNGNNNAGETYIVFGNSLVFDPSFDLSDLDGNNGFVINGINSGDLSGFSVSNGGDINGDEFDDFIIGAPNADVNEDGNEGITYVVFGNSVGFDASFDLSDLDGNNGFVINGIDSFARFGISVSGGGDFNNDGFDDFIIGADRTDVNDLTDAGSSYVIFGGSSLGGSLDLSSLDGSNGFVINGVEEDARTGFSVSIGGDINGDSFDDLIVGAPFADANDINNAGVSYVIFGNSDGFEADLDLSSINGINGFVINGIDELDSSGISVSIAGDINADGVDDLFIGASSADPNELNTSGESYTIFGNIPPVIDLNGLSDGINNSVSFIEDTPLLIDISDDIINDSNSLMLSGVEVSITNILNPGEEFLTAIGTDNISVNFDVDTGMLFLTGVDNIENYIDVLQTIEYNNTAFEPDPEDRIIDFLVNDGELHSNISDIAELTLVFNNPPDIESPISDFILDEDSFNQGVALFNVFEDAEDADEDLTFEFINDNPNLLEGSIDSSGILFLDFAPDANGIAEITVFATDTDNQSISDTFTVTVNPVNDAPSFIISDDLLFVEGDSPLQTIFDFATEISPGEGLDELDQNLTFNLTTSDDSIFEVLPEIDDQGTLTYQVAAISGEATVTVTLSDDGGTENGGIDTSTEQSFTISIISSNGPIIESPISDFILDEDSFNQGVALFNVFEDVEDADEDLTFEFINDNPNLLEGSIDSSGILFLDFAPDANGIAEITVFATDTDNQSISDTFTVTVNPVNDAPSFIISDDLLFVEGDSPLQTIFDFATEISPGVGLDELDQNLTFNLTISDDSIFEVLPEIDDQGTLTYQVAEISGEATVTVTLSDDGGTENGGIDTSAEQNFTISIIPLTDPTPISNNDIIELSSLDGSNGFVINGIDLGDNSGASVSGAGDINGDGFDDIIIGAPNANPNDLYTGASYVVFGNSNGFEGSLDLSSLNGSNGFIISGLDFNLDLGDSVSGAGDINGDGFDDIIIGDPLANSNETSLAGISYIIFGSENEFESIFDLSSLDGTNGFVINGIDIGDNLGGSVSGDGDINGDGIDDIIIGAPFAEENGSNNGQSYVIFGNFDEFEESFDLLSLDGTNGFVINGVDAGGNLGTSVSNAGDFNGDGFDDIILGAPNSYSNGSFNVGESYLVFGNPDGFDGSLDLSNLDGSDGFVINGIDSSDFLGNSVSGAGDFNGDGLDDIIIGALEANPNGVIGAGESYLIFGNPDGFDGSLDLSSLDGSDGFVINGIDSSDFAGASVSSAGDLNGDGFDDIIIGAPQADPILSASGVIIPSAGETYVVFGNANGFGESLDLSSLDGINGFVINGIDAVDNSGISVSDAGDFNGDGIDDVIIGAEDADPNGNNYAGESYVIFGNVAPVLDLNGNALGMDFSTNFTGNPTSIVDGNNLSLTDLNSDTIFSATVSITNFIDIGEEFLTATPVGNITSSFDNLTGILSLSGVDSVANYEQVLQSVEYNNTSTNPSLESRLFEFLVDDGEAHSNVSFAANSDLIFDIPNNQLSPQFVSLDVDGNNTPDALTDGILIMRFLFGFQGDSLFNDVVGDDSNYSLSEIYSSLEDAEDTILDIDDNGVADALTDGILALRYLFGFEGDSLVDGVIGDNANRISSTDIENYLDSILPSNDFNISNLI